MRFASDLDAKTLSPQSVWLRPPAAAKFLALAPQTLARWRVEGNGPKFAKFGRAVAYALDELERYARANARRSTSDLGGTDVR